MRFFDHEFHAFLMRFSCVSCAFLMHFSCVSRAFLCVSHAFLLRFFCVSFASDSNSSSSDSEFDASPSNQGPSNFLPGDPDQDEHPDETYPEHHGLGRSRRPGGTRARAGGTVTRARAGARADSNSISSSDRPGSHGDRDSRELRPTSGGPVRSWPVRPFGSWSIYGKTRMIMA